jgi:hypothetical protein
VLPEANRVDRILFSPKVLYNNKTKLFVLWYNYVPNYSYGVATSSSPFGPFKTVNTTAGSSFRFGYPNNNDIGDFSLWADEDGTGYFLYSAHDHCQVERLTDDYLASTWFTTNESSPVFPHGNEAPALFKRLYFWYALEAKTAVTARKARRYTLTRVSHHLGHMITWARSQAAPIHSAGPSRQPVNKQTFFQWR